MVYKFALFVLFLRDGAMTILTVWPNKSVISFTPFMNLTTKLMLPLSTMKRRAIVCLLLIILKLSKGRKKSCKLNAPGSNWLKEGD